MGLANELPDECRQALRFMGVIARDNERTAPSPDKMRWLRDHLAKCPYCSKKQKDMEAK